MSKSITDLREFLFQAMQCVKDGSMDIEKAKSINELAKTVVDTAKVEVDYRRISGGGASDFIEPDDAIDETDDKKLPNGITHVTKHICN